MPRKLSAVAIASIMRSIPKGANASRRKLLAEVLQSWSKNDLHEYAEYAGLYKAKPESKRLMDKIHRAAEKLDALLQEAVASKDIDYLGLMQKTRHDGKNVSDLLKAVEVIRDASGNAAGSLKQGRGQPHNVTSCRVIRDIAAMYEWLYPKKATRAVHVEDDNYEETGPFWAFASEIWGKVFGSKSEGLSAAVKGFTAKVNHEHRASPVIYNTLTRILREIEAQNS
ncbi:MAG: hypothetical protein NTZ54_08535 [Alphaproteobacteria bacterium]|nr:hypothetical protein [Alphaproteobacteria bacterium]